MLALVPQGKSEYISFVDCLAASYFKLIQRKIKAGKGGDHLYILGRERNLLEILLKLEPPSTITVKQLANKLEVSERTIHRDIKSAEKTLAAYQIKLVKKTGIGLYLEGTDVNKDRLKSLLTSVETVDYTAEERRAMILSILFTVNEPIKLFSLANELNVSIATISLDLDDLAEALQSFHLTLVRKRGLGIEISGNEKNKRAAISHFLTKYIDPYVFVSFLKENIQQQADQRHNIIATRLLGLVKPERLRLIEQTVEKGKEKLPYALADSAYIGLIVHLALAIERIKAGDNIQFDAAYMKQIAGTKEYAIAKQLILDLEKALSMEIPYDEVGYITMHLMGAKLRMNQHYPLEDISMHAAYRAKELIHYVSEQIQIDLTKNTALYNDLLAHLQPAMFRLKKDMNINNPLLTEIQRDYEELFHIIKQGAETIFPQALPDDEIGFLVLHFASTLLYGETERRIRALVICSSGIGTAKMLATRLVQEVPEINHVENKSMFDLDNMDTDSFDVIVSTIPLGDFSGEYITVSPILTKTNIQQIKKALKKRVLSYDIRRLKQADEQHSYLPAIKKFTHYTAMIQHVLDHFSVTEIKKKLTLEDLLLFVCTELEKRHYILNKTIVMEELTVRSKLNGLGIPKTTLALYHTRTNEVAHANFTIYSLAHPITIQGMDEQPMQIDTLLVMLAEKDAAAETLEILSHISSLTIRATEDIQLLASGKERVIKEFLAKHFYLFLREQFTTKEK